MSCARTIIINNWEQKRLTDEPQMNNFDIKSYKNASIFRNRNFSFQKLKIKIKIQIVIMVVEKTEIVYCPNCLL